MYSLYVGLTLIPPILQIVLGWIAGTKASRLLFSGSALRMRRKARKLISWTFILTLPAAVACTGAVMLTLNYDPIYWQDRLYVQAPLAAVPVLAGWLIAVPRLLLLRHELSRYEAEMDLQASIRARAAHPGIVVPFQAAAWGAAASLFMALAMPAPIIWMNTAIPVVLTLIVWYGLWMRHGRRSHKASNPEAVIVSRPWRSAAGGFGTALLASAIAGLFLYMAMENSKLPSRIDMASGKAEFGGGSDLVHIHDGSEIPDGLQAVSVSDLTGAIDGEPDQKFTLTAERKSVKLSSGKTIEAWTFNGQIPGPQLRIKQGELVEVTLINKDIEGGATIHWHGLDVPNAEDGVAGATQDAVMPGQSYTYRFVAEQTGTFWYHSHQHSQEAVSKGLFGSLVVDPAEAADPVNPSDETVDNELEPTEPLTENENGTQTEIEPGNENGSDVQPDSEMTTPDEEENVPQQQSGEVLASADFGSSLTLAAMPAPPEANAPLAAVNTGSDTLNTAPAETTADPAAAERDFTVMTHLWEGTFAIGSNDQVQRFDVAPGTPVRLRLINTDDWVRQSYMLVGTTFKVAAIDGTSLHEPGELQNEKLVLTTGARYDLTFTMPDGPVYLSVGGKKSLGIFMSPDGKGDLPSTPAMTEFDPLHYGEPAEVPFDAGSTFDRSFTMVLDNTLGFYNGRFNQLYTMNGAVFPDTPMYMVREGDLVKMTITNRGMVDHPMHLHGHHALVLSRNGEAADGSPWWTDTLDVEPGESYEIAFRADNPGLWMDHCHNLDHAKSGMSMHLMYEGVIAPYSVGGGTQNHPE